MKRPIGRGGMGQVWSGYHPKQRVPVAVKIMTGKQARDPNYIASFHNEVRAVAGLNHPGIIMVFDYGVIDKEAEKSSKGAFVSGSPYLAMEIANHGCLDDLARPLAWEHIKYILFSLLDALGHAHANNVIHRDIKPANVLISSPNDFRPGLKLTDFGIAQAVDNRKDKGSTESTKGTPHYMAPEQFKGAWRDYGPWTDLYALGCLAYELVCGTPPYRSESFITLAHDHIKKPLPPLVPETPVPDGLEKWIHQLLAKDPNHRFKRAADAAWNLMMIDNQDTAGPITPLEVILRGGELTPQQVARLTTPPWHRNANMPIVTSDTVIDDVTIALEEIPTPTEDLKQDALPHDWLRPPIPTEWRRPRPPAPSMRIVGAGLGLYGLRAIPLVDRLEERNAIWEAMLEVRQQNCARLMLLHGAAGNGKSRTVEWMCRRAHELGAATILKASHSPANGPADGLAWMVARHLRCLGLNRDETLDRVAHILEDQNAFSEYEHLALTELIKPARITKERTKTMVRFAGPGERHNLIQRLLERLGKDRPVIVWLDDVQWGHDALAFCKSVMDRQSLEPCPVLFLLTSRDEALAENTACRQTLEGIQAKPNTHKLNIEPLEMTDRTALVHGLLGLEGDLARQVIDRTAGNPLFAVQLVGDWVQRGVLEVGSTGFVLRAGEKAVLPDDIHQVWTAHLVRLLEKMPPDAFIALEIAAVMGRAVDNNEWQHVCDTAEVKLTINLLHRLFSSRLAIPEEDGWSFAHAMLRESLERMAKENRRWKNHHRACARMLSSSSFAHSVSERLGRHRYAAGDHELCLDPLLEGAKLRREKSDYQEALALLSLREKAMHNLQLPPDDQRWGDGWVLRSWVERLNWGFDEAHKWAVLARNKAALHNWEQVLPEALWGLGWITRQQGDHKQAKALYKEGLLLYRFYKNPLGTAHCLKGLAILEREAQNWAAAKKLYREAQDFYEACDEISGTASCLYGMGAAAHTTGKDKEAKKLLNQAMVLFQQQGEKQSVANCLNVLAEIARKEGDLDEAAQGYRQSLEILDKTIGSGVSTIPRLNLCIVLLDREQYLEAKHTLTRCLPAIEERGQRTLLAFVNLALCLCAAGLDQWSSWRCHMPSACMLLTATNMVDLDLARIAHKAASLALVANHIDEARQAYNVALEQWTSLARQDEANECRAQLDLLANHNPSSQNS